MNVIINMVGLMHQKISNMAEYHIYWAFETQELQMNFFKHKLKKNSGLENDKTSPRLTTKQVNINLLCKYTQKYQITMKNIIGTKEAFIKC